MGVLVQAALILGVLLASWTMDRRLDTGTGVGRDNSSGNALAAIAYAYDMALYHQAVVAWAIANPGATGTPAMASLAISARYGLVVAWTGTVYNDASTGLRRVVTQAPSGSLLSPTGAAAWLAPALAKATQNDPGAGIARGGIVQPAGLTGAAVLLPAGIADGTVVLVSLVP